LIAYGAVYFFGGFAFYHYKHPLLKETIKLTDTCVEPGGLYLTVAQNDSGLFFHVARLYIYPELLVGDWQFCPGAVNAEGHRCKAMPDREAWVNQLRAWGVDRILLVKDDAYLKQELWPANIPYPESLPACVDMRVLRDPS
jgi:hypothetical protein